MATLKQKAQARPKELATMPRPFPEYTTGTQTWDDNIRQYVNVPAMEVRTKGKKDPILKIEKPR